MIAVDLEYFPETAVYGPVAGPRADLAVIYCEVIQIGAVKLDAEGREIETLNLLVRPAFLSRVPEWITTMTGITEEMRKEGVSFEEGVEELAQFIGTDRDVWTFMGDWQVLSNSAKKHGVELPLYEFKLALPKLPEWGVTEESFKRAGFDKVSSGNLHKVLAIEIPKDGTSAHNALYDARSLAHSIYHLTAKR